MKRLFLSSPLTIDEKYKNKMMIEIWGRKEAGKP